MLQETGGDEQGAEGNSDEGNGDDDHQEDPQDLRDIFDDPNVGGIA